MTRVAATVARPRAVLRRRPTRPVEALIAVSWLALVAGEAAGEGSVAGESWAALLPMWVAMTMAMMLPSALPAVRHVADHSLRRRRRQAMAEFLAVYVAVWAMAGVILLAALAALPGPGRAALPVALLLAAAWQVAPAKRWALRRCHRTAPLAPSGRRATATVGRFAALNATGCVASCWALMAVTVLVPGVQAPWMAATAVAVAAEKLAERPRAVARAIAALLGVAAVVALLV
ncbi:MAG TPA: DUF2182 domain-containing protein [Solirubrobacteraceae bacterium]